MSWTDRISNIKTFRIESTIKSDMTQKLETLFAEINGDEFLETRQLLIYIDATNGNLFISAFNSETKEVFDDRAIFVELTNFWEENQNAYDFDEIIINCIKSAYNKNEKTQFRIKYKVYYQTEDEFEPIEL